MIPLRVLYIDVHMIVKYVILVTGSYVRIVYTGWTEFNSERSSKTGLGSPFTHF